VGFYRVPALEPGTYLVVKAELAGFQTSSAGRPPRAAASEVTVERDAQPGGGRRRGHGHGREHRGHELNKTSATIGHDAERPADRRAAASGGRNINNLIATSPNVSRVTSARARSPPTASARATTTT
jgi:hypothetical protein